MRVVLSSLLLLGVVSLAFVTASLYLSRQWVEEELRDRAVTFAAGLAATIGDRQDFENTRVLEAEIQRIMKARPNVQTITFVAFDKGSSRTLATTNPSWQPPLTPERLETLHRGRVVARLVESQTGRHWEVIAPVVLQGSSVGAVAVEFSLEAADRRMARVRRTSLAIAGVSILVTVLLMGLVVHWLVGKPIRELLGVIRGVEGGDRTRRVMLSQTDEFGTLGTRLNHMLDQLTHAHEQQEARVRQATAALAERYAEVTRLNDLLFHAQSRLRHAERLALMGRTIGIVAHEVGTPLHSIGGHLELLRQELPPEVVEGEADRRLAIIQSQLLRVTDTIQQLLTLVRRSAGDRAPVDVNAVLGEVLDLVSPGTTAARIAVETELAPCLPPIRGDVQQLQQAFLNLIANALDAMPGGGRLRLRTRAERRDDYTWVVADVTDSGPGIPVEHAKQIFEPFFTTKKPGKGAGLGLFITHEVVREHRGEITVESVDGQGATFTVGFPAIEEGA